MTFDKPIQRLNVFFSKMITVNCCSLDILLLTLGTKSVVETPALSTNQEPLDVLGVVYSRFLRSSSAGSITISGIMWGRGGGSRGSCPSNTDLRTPLPTIPPLL